MCESLVVISGNTASESDFMTLRKLAFLAYDLNADDQICQVDVAAFEHVYLRGNELIQETREQKLVADLTEINSLLTQLEQKNTHPSL